jgi:uncharacterized protein (UPF0248 family)
MIPIQDLLHRIRWDPSFGRGRFEIACLDRVAGRLERLSFEALQFDPEEPFGFDVAGPGDERRFIPYHRVREVYRDGALIWSRPERP